MLKPSRIQTVKRYAAWFSLGALLCVSAAFSQQPNQTAIAGLPNAKGVFYNTPTGWAAIPWNVLWPYPHGEMKSFLNFGRMTFDAEMAGLHSGFQISDPRPMFYVRGWDTPQLVQLSTKRDFRTVRLQGESGSLFEPRAPFAPHSVIDVDIAAAASGVISFRPHGNLMPGEYMIATAGAPDQRMLMLSFDFRVVGGAPR
jgi:hypothetical protein